MSCSHRSCGKNEQDALLFLKRPDVKQKYKNVFPFQQDNERPDENVEGLVYADLDMKKDGAKAKKKTKPVVIQNEPSTDYAEIDFSKPPAEGATMDDVC